MFTSWPITSLQRDTFAEIQGCSLRLVSGTFFGGLVALMLALVPLCVMCCARKPEQDQVFILVKLHVSSAVGVLLTMSSQLLAFDIAAIHSVPSFNAILMTCSHIAATFCQCYTSAQVSACGLHTQVREQGIHVCTPPRKQLPVPCATQQHKSKASHKEETLLSVVQLASHSDLLRQSLQFYVGQPSNIPARAAHTAPATSARPEHGARYSAIYNAMYN
jgi:hypothetical protein